MQNEIIRTSPLAMAASTLVESVTSCARCGFEVTSTRSALLKA